MMARFRTLARGLTGAALVMACCAPRAAAPAMVFVTPTNLIEPLVLIESRQLRGGVLKDVGEALARRMGREARFLPMPGKRVSEALNSGEADLVCYVLPGWLDGDLLWTGPVIPVAEVVAARDDAPPINRFEDLAGRRVGTVLGYRYNHLLAQPNQDLPFERFDAPDTRSNLAKLALGRMGYAIVEELPLRHYLRHNPQTKIRSVLVLRQYTTQCAQSKRSSLDFQQVQTHLAALVREGEIDRILSTYR
ncbi:substrate-binding periplasmic protein [Inhella gelatinilytica]|uniref:Transporter substrate-binding domain-containing protein n=1 Tax=Inhella gelatinilytica TaxID=2795030 RepID=A0A931IWZ2_9BURK|nr:transporter substrate-binding domain-containing protein [Inhella gelatinilytica]MBH9552584.1 transporter substrate-binding domain-containing protein [Inhella gelatinilytica]